MSGRRSENLFFEQITYHIYILLFDFYSLTFFQYFDPVSYYRNFQSKVCRIFILHYFSANILKNECLKGE